MSAAMDSLRRKHPDAAAKLLFYVIDDESDRSLADLLLTRLGIYHDKPFLMILDDFLVTERKYLSPQSSIPSAGEMADLVVAFTEGKLKPARLGQARPPNDRNQHYKDLYEVVTDSFEELVLDPAVDVLLEGYTPRCDACKAFAPRMRMLASLAAKHWPGRARIAGFNILDNDRPTEHMPEKWTPSLRLFLANDTDDDGGSSSGSGAAAAAGGAGAAGATGFASKPEAAARKAKRSVLFQYGKDSTGGAGGAGAAASETAPPEPTSSKVKVVIPTLPELLDFLQAQTRGRLAVSDAMRKEAALLEEEALVLTAAYDQCLEYMELWKAHADTIVAAAGATGQDKAVSKELQRRIVAAHKFLVHEAAGDSAERALALLQTVADYVAHHEVVERVEAVWASESRAESLAAEKA